MLQKNCVIKEHFIRVMQKGIVRSCLLENFKLLTLPVYDFVVVGFVALRPKSTAMVIAGRSVHLTTLFPGQA